MHFLLRCIFFQLVSGCGPNRMKYVCEEGKRTDCILYIRLAEYAFGMFDYNKINKKTWGWRNLTWIASTDYNYLLFIAPLQGVTHYVTRLKYLFFKGIQTKREQTERNWKRTQIKLQRQRMQDSKDMHSYIVLYIQQICMCVCASTVVICDTSAAIPTKLRRKITTP